MSLISVRLRRRLFAAALLGGASVFATPSSAEAAFTPNSIVSIGGTDSTSGPGYFSGTIAVDNISNSQAVIQVTLTNTSPAGNGGYITGFAFNDPNSSSRGNISSVTSFTQSYTPLGSPPYSNMTLIGGSSFQNTINASPYGSFDIGAATGGSFLGSGTPLPGIEVGQTGTFTFTVSGSSLNNLTAARLMATMSSGGSKSAAMLVRYRGFDDGASDKVVAGIICDPVPPPPPPPPSPPPPPNAVPAPAGAVLGLIGLGSCLFGRVVRRRNGKAAK